MTTITLKINERSKAGKTLKNMIEIFSKEKENVEIVSDESPYNPKFVKKIKRAQARGKYREVNPDNIWEGIS
jgi:hypothetical protein